MNAQHLIQRRTTATTANDQHNQHQQRLPRVGLNHQGGFGSAAKVEPIDFEKCKTKRTASLLVDFLSIYYVYD